MKMGEKIKTVAEDVDKNEEYAADLDQALAVAGMGPYNLWYSFVLSLFLMAAIIEPVGYSYVLPAAKCDLDMTDGQRGFIASIPYIGIVITSYPFGYLVDTKGRRKVLVFSSVATGIFGILSAFMPELISFVVCKFICALCLAGPAAVPYTYIGEIVPQRHRDLTLSIVNALQITGSAIVPLLAWAILPLDFRIDFGLYEFRAWRVLIILNASLFLIAALLMYFGPESPKYLVAQGKNDEALHVLQTLYAGNKKKAPADYPIKSLQVSENYQSEKRGFLTSLKEQTVPLLKAPYFKWLVLNSVLLVGIFGTLNGLYVWAPDILNRVVSGEGGGLTACDNIGMKMNETLDEGVCEDTIAQSTFMINLIANSCCAVIAVLGSSAVKIVGKKPLIVIVFCLIGVFCSLINVITNDVLFAVLLSTFPILGMTIGPVNAFSVEIFPTQLRGMAVSLTMMVGRLGSVAGANIAGALLNAACEVTFYLFGGSLIFCGLLALLLPKSGSTRQKTEEITRI